MSLVVAFLPRMRWPEHALAGVAEAVPGMESWQQSPSA
jgi:hypothetical protein